MDKETQSEFIRPVTLATLAGIFQAWAMKLGYDSSYIQQIFITLLLCASIISIFPLLKNKLSIRNSKIVILCSTLLVLFFSMPKILHEYRNSFNPSEIMFRINKWDDMVIFYSPKWWEFWKEKPHSKPIPLDKNGGVYTLEIKNQAIQIEDPNIEIRADDKTFEPDQKDLKHLRKYYEWEEVGTWRSKPCNPGKLTGYISIKSKNTPNSQWEFSATCN